MESDGSDLLSNLGAAFMEGENKNKWKETIDPILLEKNKQLKLDCYNNLSGDFKLNSLHSEYIPTEIIIFTACLLQTAKPDYEKVVFYCKEVL